ncbi:acetylesterase [Rathayibacter sp. AY1B7]|uniref:acetylxylan esterase n=1 Tax=Rathayibacter sp. AY1B7 TaxID=2080532 RepID=UPI000CE84AE5|nr:acetylxylan esterase [Rathayibacter sp. AY1B7]PPH97023.1 acetylesterase [Rathayibacter sp. AY1B7]
MFTDRPLAALREFRAEVAEPDDFDAFWRATLALGREGGPAVSAAPVDAGLPLVRVRDVRFPGFAGEPIAAWLVTPAVDPGAPLPVVIEYPGYGSGRGRPIEHLWIAAAGYAHLVVDARGQGAGRLARSGATPDPHGSGPAYPGVTTRGIESPETYYYRRLIADAALAVDAVEALPGLDPDRVSVFGGSQGGALATAAAALRPRVRAAIALVPFLSDVLRATTVTNEAPYVEIARYLATRPEDLDAVERTLSYVDGVHFSRRLRCRVHRSVGLMDPICPPSTVFASHNVSGGETSIDVWPYSGHEGGGVGDRERALEVLREVLG